jgi:hypothetical protein
MNFNTFFGLKTAKLMHPESPGVLVTVTRSWIGRLFKSETFATFTECLSAGIVWSDDPSQDENYKKIFFNHFLIAFLIITVACLSVYISIQPDLRISEKFAGLDGLVCLGFF